MEILGIDIGGSGIKGAIVDTNKGELVSERIRIPTPKPATPGAISEVISTLCQEHQWKGVVGVSFPTIIKKGRAMHFGNLDKSWEGTQVDELFQQRAGNTFYVVNDADAAAMGVMEFGEGQGENGLVMTITLGTGIGSGVFFNGELLSNFELGRLYGKKGDIMEYFASDAARKRNDWDFKKWGKRLNFFLNHIEKSFNPDLIIIGGGVSKKIEHFKAYIDIETPFKAAQLKNNAGIVGAALFARRNC
ncbi:MAG: polyphosphate--glucose phosphotransferase [Flavobacteriaceae bacterium]